MDTNNHQVSLRNVALGLLARREHSRKELQQKLARKLPPDASAENIPPILDQLAEQGLQSDERFVESYVNMRVRKGYGPVRIAMELAERGVENQLVQIYLEEREDWQECLMRTWQKKFGRAPTDFSDKAKQMRFLQFRGYRPDDITQLFNAIEQ
jgi:regulatory protein